MHIRAAGPGPHHAPESGAQGPTHLGISVGARLLAHGVEIGHAAAEVEDVSSGQRQLHGIDVRLLR